MLVTQNLNVRPICVIKSDLTEIFKTGFTSIEIWTELVKGCWPLGLEEAIKLKN